MIYADSQEFYLFSKNSVVKAFKEVPSHLTTELHLFTLADLYNVKQKTLLPGLRELLALAVTHVEDCEVCRLFN